MISLRKMAKTLKITGIGVILFFVLLLNSGFGQDTIIISPYDTAAIKAIPERIESIIREKEEKKKRENLILEDEGDAISYELDGLIIDETISKIGHDFYKYYQEYWHAPEGAKDYTIYIGEKLIPGMGNLIYIKIDDQKVFENRITPKDYTIEKTAQYATNRIREYLKQTLLIQQQLEEGDMSGTGIY